MAYERIHLTKDEAAAKGWYCLADLKTLFRLKPAPMQGRAGTVWQGQTAYDVFEKAKCVAMRPYRPATEAQRHALNRGRMKHKKKGKRNEYWED
jgi:hypothetical protein